MECNMITNGTRIVRGNAFSLRIVVKAYDVNGSEIEGFVLNPETDTLLLTMSNAVRPMSFILEDGSTNHAIVSLGAALQTGYYGLDFSGIFGGVAWRFSAKNVFQIVEMTSQGNVPKDGVVYNDTYETHAEVTLTSMTDQADWAENDPTSPSYIRNKPTIYTKAEINVMMAQKQDVINDLQQIREGAAAGAAAAPQATTYSKIEVNDLIKDFITKTVNDLTNYYLKSETYTQTEVNQLIAAIKQFRYQVVDSIPTASADTMGIIYLVPSSNPETRNVKDEYITLSVDEGSGIVYYWEQIGSTTVDLSGYYTSAQTDTAITTAINTALADYSTTSQMTAAIATAIANYYTKAEVDALIANFITASVNNLVNYYLKTDTYTKAEVQQLIDAVKQFTYQSVSTLPTASADTMNKIYLVPSTNPETRNVKDEFITIAVTDQGTTTYSWEQIGSTTIDLSGYYTSAQTDTAISNALAAYSTTEQMNTVITTAINTALADYSTTSQMTAAIATAIANYYTKAEVDALIANFITASVNNLVNYYLKSETFTKAEVNQLIAAVQQFTYQSVAELPTASADTMNKIYLVPSTNPKTKNVKDEYITIAVTDQGTTTYSWEQIGSTTVDLSGYYTSAQTDTAISNALASYSTTQQMNTAITNALNTALADYSTTSQMTAAIATAIANYYTKAEVDALIANFITASVNNLVNYYLKSETFTKAEVNQLIAAVQQFTYQSVAELPTASADTMNKIYLVPSTNPKTKNVKDEYITISVTDQGATTYSWEQIGSTTVDLSGYYTSAQTETAITNALASYSTTQQMNTAITNALNTALADYSTTSQMTAAIATAIASYYTKSEVDALIANFITKSVNDLVNYYLKSEVFTKAEVNALIAAIQQFQYVSVTTLPTASADTMNKIYLVPSTNPGTQNVKDEYITIAVTDQGTTTYSWEVIGSTDIDLANYYTKQQTDGAITHALNTALADYTTTANLTTLLQGKQDTLTFDDAPTENSNNPVKSGGIYSALTGKEPVITNMAKKGFGKGTCSTAAATQAKTVTISNFLLLTNCIVTVYFQNAVGVTAATLNVSDTGAKPIMINGVTPQPGVIPPKSTVMLQYDGTNWNVISIQQLDLSFSPDYLFVDMGLPSGLMWAKRNIDVTQPNGFAASEFQYECSFFSWGNVECHNPISDSAFDYDFGSSNEGPYASTPGAALTGDASLSYDAARINCGAPWRLPTTSEFAELFNNIDYIDANGDVIDPSQTNKLVTVNGIVGLFLKSKVNGNRLFFPCSGYGLGTSWRNRGSDGLYWSSSLDSAARGRLLGFSSGGVGPQSNDDRFYGFTGRAVQ